MAHNSSMKHRITNGKRLLSVSFFLQIIGGIVLIYLFPDSYLDLDLPLIIKCFLFGWTIVYAYFMLGVRKRKVPVMLYCLLGACFSLGSLYHGEVAAGLANALLLMTAATILLHPDITHYFQDEEAKDLREKHLHLEYKINTIGRKDEDIES